jgi:hypothetical protein
LQNAGANSQPEITAKAVIKLFHPNNGEPPGFITLPPVIKFSYTTNLHLIFTMQLHAIYNIKPYFGQ